MNIYWCFEKNDYFGLYVIAETRGKAKQIFADEIGESYIDIRSHIYRRGVNERKGIIEAEDTKLLNKYNLEYADEEQADNWGYECVL